jgi:hypothetical protein
MLDAHDKYTRRREAVQEAAFAAWSGANNAQFWLMLAYRNGTDDSLTQALDRMETACRVARAKLEEVE